MIKINRNRLVFVVIVGSAICLVGLMAFGGWWQEQQTRYSGSDATNTALAARIITISLNATAVAQAVMTADAVRGTEVILAEQEQALAATSTAMAVPTTAATATIDEAAGIQVTKEGLQLEILQVNYDAWRVVKAQNQFNEPPWEGKRMVLVKMQVTNIANNEDDPPDIDESDFRIMGEREEVYTPYSEEASCGVIPDELDGVLFPGEMMSGNICFQISEQETELQLIYYPDNRDDPRLYFDLVEGD